MAESINDPQHVTQDYRPNRNPGLNTDSPSQTVEQTLDFASSQVPDRSAALPAIPGYEILAEIGRGGMGVVYKARQIKANRIVALKMILGGTYAGSNELERFRIEVEAKARLKHHGIVQIYEVGEHDGVPFYSMEFAEAGSLVQWGSRSVVTPEAAAAVLERIARAIESAHVNGIVHRDLKPANILISLDGTPKISDFGLAKRMDIDAGQTRSGAIMGTPTYMAPEQAAGNTKSVGPAADIYALGVILYELLTGTIPFTGESLPELLQNVIQNAPEKPSLRRAGIPRDLETICLKCLEKHPSHRYPTAGALAEDLRRYLEGEAISARELGVVERLTWLLGRSHNDVQLAKYADFFFWLVPIMLLPEIVATIVRFTDATVWWDVAGFSLRPIGLAILLLKFGKGRFWPANLAEQHTIGVWGGFVLVVIMLTVCLGRFDNSGAMANRGMYQGYAAAAAVGFFAMGAMFWGACYILGGVFLLLMPILGIEPKLAPLEYGVTWAIVLLIIGVRLRQLSHHR